MKKIEIEWKRNICMSFWNYWLLNQLKNKHLFLFHVRHRLDIPFGHGIGRLEATYFVGVQKIWKIFCTWIAIENEFYLSIPLSHWRLLRVFD